MSDEDKLEDAIARLLAGAGGTWSAYSPVTTCNAAWQEVQSSCFCFYYIEAKWKLTGGGLSPGQMASTNVQYWRRQYGVGDFALYATDPIMISADGSGNFEAEGDVPNDEGFETYAVEGPCQPPTP